MAIWVKRAGVRGYLVAHWWLNPGRILHEREMNIFEE